MHYTAGKEKWANNVLYEGQRYVVWWATIVTATWLLVGVPAKYLDQAAPSYRASGIGGAEGEFESGGDMHWLSSFSSLTAGAKIVRLRRKRWQAGWPFVSGPAAGSRPSREERICLVQYCRGGPCFLRGQCGHSPFRRGGDASQAGRWRNPWRRTLDYRWRIDDGRD